MSKKLYVLDYDQWTINEAWYSMNEDGELSPKQKAYQELMLFGLAKFGAETPADLSDEDKSEFFNWIKDNWDKEKGAPKDKEVAADIKKAKEKGLIDDPEKQAKKASGGKDAEKTKEKEAEDKKKDFADKLK